ncbi:ATP-NAD kinase [Punctularia strigosozonata HHB-11173 SS5]|uniref:ATP-NAD kinase n=1 Tax=Punctularia strigosozonata (strain HHB-11173) TaxID=741275 RepID=UPI00044166DD|nr:ATP-NAD kinase [Punctularia strigosozonata HHB-11173 SS5]EIN06708.1 ATP-NAD kinase [Punctularia strigosozonata HHB-11173 SS5]
MIIQRLPTTCNRLQWLRSSWYSSGRSFSSLATPNAQRKPPKSVLIVNKTGSQSVLNAIDKLHKYFEARQPEVKVLHEDVHDAPTHRPRWAPGSNTEPIDLVVTLGGDGTILHASSLFKTGAVPPVLSFSMGTLGFLLPFHFDDHVQALDRVFNGTYGILHRMRLSCTFHAAHGTHANQKGEGWQVMNEVTLHRSAHPGLNIVDIFVDGQHLTEAVADGLIISTPTGSTAYSLSAGGPILHPTMEAIILTPVCPRSLSFRPLVFPASASITLRINNRSRAPAGTFMDGQETHILNPGDSVTVSASPYPIPCISRSSIADCGMSPPGNTLDKPTSTEDDFVKDINSLLQYNATFRSKALLKHDR